MSWRVPRSLGAELTMKYLANADRLDRVRMVLHAGPVGHTGFWERRWSQGMARTRTEQVWKRYTEKAVVVLDSWLDVEKSSTAVGMVICRGQSG